MDVNVRPELPDDAAEIARVNREAFGRDDEGGIVERMRADPAWVPELSLIAEVDERMIGHILLSRAGPDYEKMLLALGPIAVVPELQRNGVGRALMRTDIERATTLGYRGIVLIGHPTYYPRFGFLPASRFGIILPYDVPDDVGMALPLFDGALDGLAGHVTFPAAFAGL